MSSMSLYASLNRRHKVVIFVVLIGAGLVVMGDRSLSEGLGVMLIGVAIAWAVGSNYRPVHVALLMTGIIMVFGGPIAPGWRDHQSAMAKYQSAMARYPDKVAMARLWQETERKRYEQEVERGSHEKELPPPLDVGVLEPSAPEKPPPLTLSTAFSDHWGWMVPGLLLACLALGLILGVKPKFQVDTRRN